MVVATAMMGAPMGKSFFRKRGSDSAERGREREPAEDGRSDQDAGVADDDVVAWLDLPPDFSAPDSDAGAYRRSRAFEFDGLEDAADEAKWAAYMAQD
jgi:hypothetical protein